MSLTHVILASACLFGLALTNASCSAGNIDGAQSPVSPCNDISTLLSRARLFSERVSKAVVEPIDQESDEDISDLYEEAEILGACSVTLTERELYGDDGLRRDVCDPFPIGITIAGIEDSLKEIHSCRKRGCAEEEQSLMRAIVIAQNKRLLGLVDDCTGPGQLGSE